MPRAVLEATSRLRGQTDITKISVALKAGTIPSFFFTCPDDNPVMRRQGKHCLESPEQKKK